jgi:Helix-turn-helix domain
MSQTILRKPPQGTQHDNSGQPRPRLLYPKEEAGFLLGISERSIDYLISSGRLKTKRIGKRNLVPADELRRFIRSDRTEAIRPSRLQ